MKGRKPSELAPGTITEVPRPPSWLSAAAKAEWKRLLPDLVERKVISPADLGAVEDLCVARGKVREIDRQMKAAGSIDLRLARLQNAYIATARQLAAEIGCTPVARTRAAAAEDAAENTSWLD